MSDFYKLNFPMETEAARSFWSSRLKLNRCKAIMAVSLNLDNANDNLRRFGYSRQFRKRALKAFASYINNPSMTGIPFSNMEDKWWEVMPYVGD